jgi:hypothetical protein
MSYAFCSVAGLPEIYVSADMNADADAGSTDADRQRNRAQDNTVEGKVGERWCGESSGVGYFNLWGLSSASAKHSAKSRGSREMRRLTYYEGTCYEGV